MRRWLAAVTDAADDLVALWQARNRVPFPWAGTVLEIRERGDPLTRGDLAIGGNDVVALGGRSASGESPAPAGSTLPQR